VRFGTLGALVASKKARPALRTSKSNFGHCEVTIGQGPNGQCGIRLSCHMKAIAAFFALCLLTPLLSAQANLSSEFAVTVDRSPGSDPASSEIVKAIARPDSPGADSSHKSAILASAGREEPLAATNSPSAADSELNIAPAPEMLLLVKPSQTRVERPTISARQRHIWMSLIVAEHGAAFVDALSTRDGIRSGGRELNPVVRPFAHSPTLYPALQVVPVGLDYLSLWWMRSNHRLLRKFWWVPQTVSTAASVYCGTTNLLSRR
jgi:hypothetical protein